MTLLDAIILGIIEGLTEFLPVSSTGHLILAQSLMKLGTEVDSYLIGIQLGAILAVALYYRQRVFGMIRGILSRGADGKSGRDLAIKLVIAFLPAAAIGFLFSNMIEELFFNPFTVGLALVIGGIVMIVAERATHPDHATKTTLEDATWKDALLVGIAQCCALWPGMSRSMTTMVGGQLRGFSNSLAADFSFLLALPTLGAATVYSLLKDHRGIIEMENGVRNALVGIVVAFVVAWAAVAVFLRVLKRIGMTPFGVYRIVIGCIVLALAFAKIIT